MASRRDALFQQGLNLAFGGLEGLGREQKEQQALARQEEANKRAMALQQFNIEQSIGKTRQVTPELSAQIGEAIKSGQYGGLTSLIQQQPFSQEYLMSRKKPEKELLRGEKLRKQLTPGELKADEAFAKDYQEFEVQGGFADVEKSISQLEEAKKALESGTDKLTGPLIGSLPRAIKARTYPESMAVQEAVEEVVQRNLRLILGPQFTDDEGKRLIARAFNPALSEKENAKRVGRLLDQIKTARDAKIESANYFREHGTISKFNPRRKLNLGMNTKNIERRSVPEQQVQVNVPMQIPMQNEHDTAYQWAIPEPEQANDIFQRQPEQIQQTLNEIEQQSIAQQPGFVEVLAESVANRLVGGNLPAMRAATEKALSTRPMEELQQQVSPQEQEALSLISQRKVPDISKMTPQEITALSKSNSPGRVDEILAKSGFQEKQPTIEELRQQEIKKFKEKQSQRPLAAAIGEVAGEAGKFVALAPLFSAGPLSSFLTSAGLGLIESPITGEEENVGKEGKERLINAAISSVSDLAFRGAGRGVREIATGIKRITSSGPNKIGFGKRIASALTGLSEQDIHTFATKTKEVERLAKRVSGDFTEAVDIAKEKLARDLRNTRQQISNKISAELRNVSREKVAKTSEILKQIVEFRNELNPALQKEAISEIDDVLATAQKLGDSLDVKELFQLKEFLQDRSKAAFFKANQGKIFTGSDKASKAIKRGATKAKRVLDEVAPVIKKANTKLFRLHNLEETMNRSLITPGKPAGQFISAGRGINKRNEKLLKELGKITNTDPLEKAKLISAGQSFARPSIVPVDVTGKSATRLIIGGALGGAVGEITETDPTTAAFIGAALTSPASLKAIIKGSNITSRVINNSLNTLKDPRIRQLLIQSGATNDAIDSALNSIEREAQNGNR